MIRLLLQYLQLNPTYKTIILYVLNYSRNLHLPDGQTRPQPRRPPLPTQPVPSAIQTHPLYDALPRQPIHPATHKQSGTTERLANQGHSTEGSFTFLTSTCSEGEPTENSDTTDVSRETYIVNVNRPRPTKDSSGPVLQCSQTIHSQDCRAAPHDDRFLTDIQRPSDKQVNVRGSSAYQPQPVHLTQTTLSGSNSHCKSQSIEKNNQTDVYSYPHSSDGLPSSLADSSVQVEIVQMRDNLKYFHQLKAHQKWVSIVQMLYHLLQSLHVSTSM